MRGALPVRFLHEQRADADQPAVGIDERGAAPLRMCGRGEQGLFQQVFPVAGEFAAAGDARRQRMLGSRRAR